MKSLTTLFKNSISTCFLLFLSIVSYGQLPNFTKVQQNDGLIMQRFRDTDTSPGIGLIDFHCDTLPDIDQKFDYMYMRATKDDNNNNTVITNDGTMMIGSNDGCGELREMKESLDTSSTTIKLYVKGSIAVSDGNATNIVISDARFKKNISPLENSLDIIRQTNFVQFQYNDLSGVASKQKYYGVLAQQMQEVLPSTVRKSRKLLHPTDKQGTDFLMFNPNDLIYSGLNAIKELDEENQVLKEKVVELEKEVAKTQALEQRVNQLEEILNQFIGKEQSKRFDDFNSSMIQNTASYLKQNQPNPLYKSTSIEYSLPDNVTTAHIQIQDLTGHIITQIALQNKNSGKVTFNAEEYGINNGTYIYSLITDGKIIASKKMMLIK